MDEEDLLQELVEGFKYYIACGRREDDVEEFIRGFAYDLYGDEIEAELYQRLLAEQERYKAQLLTLSPEEILEKAEEYVARKNILDTFEAYLGEDELSESKIDILTEVETKDLMKSLLELWRNREASQPVEAIWDCVMQYIEEK